MNDTIKIYGASTPERQRLESAAMLINSNFNPNHATARVSDEWFDFEGGVKWTTLMIGAYPALNPLQQAMITRGSLEDYTKVVAAVIVAHRDRMNMLTAVRYGLEEEEEA